jgi:hypothetical protein
VNTTARPKSANPKSNLIGLRLTDTDRELLDKLMARTGLEQDAAIRLLIRNADLQKAQEAVGR